MAMKATEFYCERRAKCLPFLAVGVNESESVIGISCESRFEMTIDKSKCQNDQHVTATAETRPTMAFRIFRSALYDHTTATAPSGQAKQHALKVGYKVREETMTTTNLSPQLLVLALMLMSAIGCYSFTIQPHHSRRTSFSIYQSESCLFSSFQDDENNNSSNQEDHAANEVEPVYETVIKMDDGGSDLTDRFKYKVNALMGVFDPQTGVDDEHQSGNIVNALLKFPAQYSFNAVGRTSGDDKLKEDFVQEIKDIVSSLSGDDEMEVRITPRGKNFTRITLQVTVESVAVMNAIYDALEKNEKTLMQY